MRRIPSVGDRVASTMAADFSIHLSSPLTPPFKLLAPEQSPPARCDSQKCPWWPYSSAKDFKMNTALILVVLFCALISALAFNAAIRYFIHQHCLRRRRRHQQTAANEKEELAEVEIPSLIYSDGVKSEVAETECIICLSEFAIGDKLRVLEKCSHGFHLRCIQQWLVSHSSCPTCRTNCSIDSDSASS